MKRTAMMAIAGLWLCAAVTPQAQEAPKTAPATHVTKEQIQEFIAKLPNGRISDSAIRAIDVGGYRVGVFAVVRPKDSPQDAIYHDTNMTEILYILEGSATLITGGTIPDARPPTRPGGNFTGTRIDGGTRFRAMSSSRRGERRTCGRISRTTCRIWFSGRIRAGHCH